MLFPDTIPMTAPAKTSEAQCLSPYILWMPTMEASPQAITSAAGFSYYNGKVEHVYEPVDTVASNVNTKYYIYYFGDLVDTAGVAYHGFYIDSAQTLASGTTGSGVSRIYYGADAQIEFKSPFGKTEISKYFCDQLALQILFIDQGKNRVHKIRMGNHPAC